MSSSAAHHHHHRQLATAAAAAAATAAMLYCCCCCSPELELLVARARRWLARRRRRSDGELRRVAALDAAPPPAPPSTAALANAPLRTLGELWAWTAAEASDAASAGLLLRPRPLPPQWPLPPPADADGAHNHHHHRRRPPRLVVCHDMMGGYLPSDGPGGAVGCGHHRLWHYDVVDVCVYFSHEFVTVPPAAWVHAAHAHGARCLGTLITEQFGERDRGEARCRALFGGGDGDGAEGRRLADQLVALAKTLGFEGWLINLENGLQAPREVEGVLAFLGYLRARLASEVPGGTVVWYDAVTTDGRLDWQNGLTAKNAPFFGAVDGLFTNYTWQPGRDVPGTVARAGARGRDVFMGVDVHGRGSYGGGRGNVGVALRAAADAGLSAAIFAPGWTWENLERRDAGFAAHQERWWRRVAAAWPAGGRPVVAELPFATRFNAGAGRGWFERGALVAAGDEAAAHAAAAVAAAAAAAAAAAGPAAAPLAPAPRDDRSGEPGWHNLMLTDALPFARDPATQRPLSGLAAQLTSSTAYAGGASLLVFCAVDAAAEQAQQPDDDDDDDDDDRGVAAGEADAPRCLLKLHSKEGGGAAEQYALLQLFTAAVPLGGLLGGDGGGGGDGGVTKAVVEVALVSASARPCSVVPWLMTEQQQQAGSSSGGGSSGSSSRRRVLHLPAAAAEPLREGGAAGSGSGSGSAAAFVLDAQAQAPQQQEDAGAAAPAVVLLPPPHVADVDAAWCRNLEGSVGAASNGGEPWRWRRRTTRLELPLARRAALAGVGVAVRVAEGDRGAVAALVGELSVRVLGLV